MLLFTDVTLPVFVVYTSTFSQIVDTGDAYISALVATIPPFSDVTKPFT